MPCQAQGAMIDNSHLVLHHARLPAATERSITPAAWLFLQVLQGAGHAFRGTSSWLLSEGDVLVNAPGRVYQLRASQLGELSVHYFQVCPELLTGTISAAERQHLERAARLERDFPRHLTAASLFAQQLTELAKQATANHTLLARCEMLRLAAVILTEHLPPPAPLANQAVNAKQRFGTLVSQMVEDELQHQSAEELARRCGCSVRHFSRLFRDHFGHSIIPARTELCLHKAKQLLEESDAKIIDVAMDSGFNHVGLFSSRFKKRFGYTPSEWRKRRGQSK